MADLDADKIHGFRVEYKKLRAFLRMMSSVENGYREIGISKNLKKAYHISGSIRDLELQVQRIQEISKNDSKKTADYIDVLQKEEKKLGPELFFLLDEEAISDSKKKTDSILPGHFRINDFLGFIDRNWSSIKTIIISKNFSDDHIHSVRKSLKDIFYNANLYSASYGKHHLRQIWRNKGAKYIDKLLDQLGRFQDKCTAISLIKPYWMIDFDERSQQFLHETKSQWIKEKRKLKRQLVIALTIDLVE